MNLLSEYFYKYLLSNPETAINDAIMYATSLGLTRAPEGKLVECVRDLGNFPENYRPGEPHTDTIRWLSERKIKSLWYPDEDVNGALAILDDGKKRDLIEAALLMPVSLKTVLDEIPYNISEKSVRIYEHYFFNTKNMASDDIIYTVSNNPRHRMLCDVHPDEDVALSVMKHLYGLAPSSVSAGRAAKLVIGATSAKLLSTSRSDNTNDDALRASRYMSVIQKGQEIIADGALAAEELIDVLNSISVERTDHTMPTYKDLTGKEYVPEEEEER